jgi:hypothetical protein
MAKKISYTNRDFASIRQDLVNLTKEYYPELVKNTNDASIFSVLLDLNAAVSDNLHFHIDRVWQETMLDFAQQKQSLFHIAKTYGLRIPGNRPSVSLCDFSINVPVKGDKEDERYLGIIRAGVQVTGAGIYFETIDDIDFSSSYNSKGESNRLKIPNFDANNRLISYTITKREAVVNGFSKIYRKVITSQDQKPFLKIYLPEQNVLGVTSIIHKEGVNYANNPSSSEFNSNTNRWYEVKNLMENKVFIPDSTSISDRNNFKSGVFVDVNNKFVTELTPEGFYSITFGSGTVNQLDNLDNYINGNLKVNLSSYLNNTSLGAIPKIGTTIFIKYRIGGGIESNLGVGVINTINDVEFSVNGPNETINSQVLNSLRVTNVTPAIGGADKPTVEEIRQMISYNFSAQNRAVTLNDYKSLIETMPSLFGAPAKVNVIEEDNKIKIKLLSYDENGNLTNLVSTTLKNNIMNYLSQYRMINDYIEIATGEVIDLGVELDVIIDKNVISTEVIREIITKMIDYFSIDKRKMGDPLFVNDLNKTISSEINGIVNITDIRIYNKIGDTYSDAQVSQTYKDTTTKEILQSDSIIYMKPNQIFQIRYPNKDIRIRVKTLGMTTF